jgi:hypothetical protein
MRLNIKTAPDFSKLELTEFKGSREQAAEPQQSKNGHLRPADSPKPAIIG